MTWTPGTPVVTAQDHADWEAWRKERKREGQRQRRARYPRIDYYPDDYADQVIRGLVGTAFGVNFSDVISRIVSEWAEDREEVPPE